jgi:hypothetical protein
MSSGTLYKQAMANYIIWSRRTDVPDALWADMPYTRHSRSEAEQLMEHYEEQWGSLYEFEVHTGGRFGTFPKGTRQPCYVGIND